MFENKIINRIPGAAAVSPKEKQGFVEELGKLSKVQLVELLERQNSLLRNKGFVNRLPDKGEKITAFKNRLESELNRRKEVDKTTALLENLNINCPVEEIEWMGKYSKENPDGDEETSKVDYDETNVIKMLASHGRTSKIERLASEELSVFQIGLVLKPPEELITKEDIEEIYLVKDPYAKALCSKVAEVNSHPIKERYKPFRTLRNKEETSPKQRPSSRSSLSDGQHPEEGGGDTAMGDAGVREEGEGKGDKGDGASSADGIKRVRHWEVTAATPPLPIHEKTLLLDLEQSIALEKAAVDKTIEARTAQSMARLAEQLQRGSFTQYRDTKEVRSDDDDDGDDEDNNRKQEEHEECGDEDEEPERDVAIVYSIVECNDEAG